MALVLFIGFAIGVVALAAYQYNENRKFRKYYDAEIKEYNFKTKKPSATNTKL